MSGETTIYRTIFYGSQGHELLQTDEDLLRISLKMKAGENDNISLMNKVKQSVGETSKEGSTDLLVSAWKTEWVPLRGGEAGVYRTQEVPPESGPDFVIPQVGVGKISLGLGPKNDFECHPRLRILFLTSDQGEPTEGFLRKVFRRRSSSSFCEEVSFTARGTAAMLSQTSSTSRILSEILSFRTSAKGAFFITLLEYHFCL